MKIIIAGGGTGGHLFPGIAMAEEFKRRDSSSEIIFVGTEHGIESKVLPREGYKLRYIRSEGIAGKSAIKRLKGMAMLSLSFIDARRILKTVEPDIVIGVGGYSSGAIVLTAAVMSIPTMIHEQNSVPGSANRILCKFVDCICVTYQESMPAFPIDKTVLTGNPIRMKILKGEKDSACRLFSLNEKLFTVFVFGGSTGARSINRAMVDALNYLGELKEDIQFLHQTGDADFEGIRGAYRNAGVKGTVAPFIYQMAEAYAAADVVISRAGATTLAELTALGKPAILVPYPYAAGRHQEFNALKLQEMGAAKVVQDRDLQGKTLAAHILDMYRNHGMLFDMQKASRGLGRPDAGSRIVDIAMSLIKNHTAKKRER